MHRRRLVKIIYQHVSHNFEYRIMNIEQGMSKDGAPAAQSFLEIIYGAKRRLSSKFGVPCSSFDIPAEGGSFFKRSLEKSLGAKCQGRGGVSPPGSIFSRMLKKQAVDLGSSGLLLIQCVSGE
jgi:hypothetical protein